MAEKTIYGSSNWLIVGLSVERLVMTVFPLKSRWLLRPKRSLRIAWSIVAVNLLVQSYVISDSYSVYGEGRGKCVSWAEEAFENLTKHSIEANVMTNSTLGTDAA